MHLTSKEPSVEVTQGDLLGTLDKEIWTGGIEGHLSLVRTVSTVKEPKLRVLLIHGFAQNRYSWDSPGRSFSDWLALNGLEVWNLELSGHGRSSTTTQKVGFDNYVEDAVSVIEHFAGDVVLIGHSLGGSVAYAAAGKTGVRGVVGLAAIYQFGEGNEFVRWLCRLTTAISPILWSSMRIKTRGAGSLLGRMYGLSDIMGYTLPMSGWWPGSMEREILADRLELGFDWTNLNVWLDMSRWASSGEVGFHSDWVESATPVFAIAGDRDTLAPMSAVRGAYDQCTSEKRALREFDLYEDGFHWGHLDLVLGREAPEIVWPEILQWVQQL